MDGSTVRASSHFDKVTQILSGIRYMNAERAGIIRDFIQKNDISDVLEIGFYQGKSSAYFAAIMEDRGKGHLTTIDLEGSKERTPNIHENLDKVGLAHRVTPVYVPRSHTWELGKMAQLDPRPQFDMCYFDGGHTWDTTGFGFVLVHLLLKPGGWIVFDDMNWTPARSLKNNPNRKLWRRYSEDEKNTPAVRLTFELLSRELGYVDHFEVPEVGWGFARKPL